MSVVVLFSIWTFVNISFNSLHRQASWLGGLSMFFVLAQVVKASDPESKNPAVNRKMNMVGEELEVGAWKKYVEP